MSVARLDSGHHPVREHWLPAMLLLAGMVVTLSAYFTIRGELDSHRQTEFSWEAHNRNNALKKGIEDGLESVKAVRDLFRSSEHVSQSEFRLFAQALLARYRGIHALEWVSMTKRDVSKVGELSAKQDSELPIIHEDQFPVTYIEPLPQDGPSLGFDYGSVPLHRELMDVVA